MRLVFACFLSFLGLVYAIAQNAVIEKTPAFEDDVVPKVYIIIPEDSLAEILDPKNKDSDYHYRASFVFDNGRVRDSIGEVGFRLRGNTSRKAQKKSFKVSFNEYVADQKFYGLEKLNLNGEHNDPTISRAKLCFDFLRDLKVPASRANQVEFYINGDFFGVYLNVEHIDEEFTKSRFGGEGPLYKCLYGADLAYRGAAASSYDLPYYELKKPKGAGDYEELAYFIDVLNNTSDDNFVCELEKVFNVDRYLKCIVMDVLTGNWDGPNYNKNNFYLYHNPTTQIMEYIPYDLDNTLGVDFLGRDWSTRNIYNWSRGTSGRPLFDKIIKHDVFKEKYTYLLNQALNGYFKVDSITTEIYKLKSLIQSAAERDTYRMLDYGFTTSDFNNSFGYFSKEHVDQGLVDFVKRRSQSAFDQINSVKAISPSVYWHNYTLDYEQDSVTFQVSVEGHSLPIQVQLSYNWEFQSAIWKDSMRWNKDSSFLSTTIAWRPDMDQLSYWFELEDGGGVTSVYPSCDMFQIVLSRGDIPLYINELMASNQNGITDEEGKMEDWFEIYYDGDEFHNFKGYYVTDDINEPFKYPLSSQTIGPKSFHLFWADSDVEDGDNHTNFKLSAAGEELAIFDSRGTLIDYIEFGQQSADISYGRSTDGGSEWIYFNIPTPRISNTGEVNSINSFDLGKIVCPNPFRSTLNLVVPYLSRVQVYSSDGVMVYVGSESTISADLWSSGLYVVEILMPTGTKKVVRAIKL